MAKTFRTQVAAIYDEIQPFLRWLYEQSNGQAFVAVNAHAYRQDAPDVTTKGIDWLIDHLAQKRLIKQGAYLPVPVQANSLGTCPAIALTRKGLRVAEQAFHSSAKPSQPEIVQQPKTSETKDWATVTEAATATGVVKSTITKLCDRGEIKSTGNGRDRRVDLNSLRAYKIALDKKRL